MYKYKAKLPSYAGCNSLITLDDLPVTQRASFYFYLRSRNKTVEAVVPDCDRYEGDIVREAGYYSDYEEWLNHWSGKPGFNSLRYNDKDWTIHSCDDVLIVNDRLQLTESNTEIYLLRAQLIEDMIVPYKYETFPVGDSDISINSLVLKIIELENPRDGFIASETRQLVRQMHTATQILLSRFYQYECKEV